MTRKENNKRNNNELRFISLDSDSTFKYLYKNEKTRKWINSIIDSKFGIDLSKYNIVDNELNTGNNIKDYRLDLKLENDNTIVILEMNSTYYDFLQNKNYQYLYRVAGSRYDKGEDYINKKTILILFNNFLNPKDPANKTGNYLFMDPNTNLVIDDIESYEIYLPNFKKVCYDSNEIDIRLSLFNATSYEEMRRLTNNSEDLEIIEELERLSMDEKFLGYYDAEAVKRKTENSIRKEGYKYGFQEGYVEGVEERNIEIVKKMLAMNLSIEDIKKATDLSFEEIENINKNN